MALPKSKYEEDVYINNHTTVWGSWWRDHQWGYKCCKQVIRNSYCTGTAGIEAAEAASDLMKANIARKEATQGTVPDRRQNFLYDMFGWSFKSSEYFAALEFGCHHYLLYFETELLLSWTDTPAPVEDKNLATWGTDIPDDLVLDEKLLAKALKKVSYSLS